MKPDGYSSTAENISMFVWFKTLTESM